MQRFSAAVCGHFGEAGDFLAIAFASFAYRFVKLIANFFSTPPNIPDKIVDFNEQREWKKTPNDSCYFRASYVSIARIHMFRAWKCLFFFHLDHIW